MQDSQYRILNLIGQGQFGRVFSAENINTGEVVALKNLEPEACSTKMFLHEVNLLVNLKHPNIIGFQGLEYNESGRYLVMDYCEGGNLRDFIESGNKLSLIEILKLIADVLSGLEVVHRRKIVHCDLKPENILLKAEKTGWTACISDFGIAKFTEEVAGTSKGLGDIGSPAYMAPERFYGRYCPASDLYAVGIILFELVVGQRPFLGTPADLSYAHFNEKVEIPRSVPFILRSTINKSLEKLPNNRFTSAKEMLNSINLATKIF